MPKSKNTTPSKPKQVVTKSEVISYQLSNPTFVTTNCTKLPPVILPSGCFPTKPWSCFKKRRDIKLLYYPKGQLAAQFNLNGTGKVYYIDGSTAVDLTESISGYKRIHLYSEPLPPNGEQKCLGWLDPYGNCVICDFEGNAVSHYNQIGGMLFNKDGVLKWEWANLTKSSYKTEKKNSDPRKLSFKPVATISEELLKLHMRKSAVKLFKLQSNQIYFQCKVSNCISLWIFSQEKIELAFSSEAFIIRIDVGVAVGQDDRLSKRKSGNHNKK